MKKFKLKILTSILFILCIASNAFAQNKDSKIREINGKVTHLGKALVDVNIRINDSKIGTKTNSNGEYIIKANIGDVIYYSYIGYNTVSIVVEDVTAILNIELKLKTNILEEAVVTAKKNEVITYRKIYQKKIKTAAGKINPTLFPSTVLYFKGDDISLSFPTLRDFLRTKTNKVPNIFDVDGLVYHNVENPPLSIALIEDLYVITGGAGTRFWGGPVVIIRTKSNKEVINEKRNEIAEKYKNQNYYDNDALIVNIDSLNTSNHLKKFIKIKNKQEAYNFYNDNLKTSPESYGQHILVAQKFRTKFNDYELASKALDDLVKLNENNPEILKAIAYQFQTYNSKKRAIKIYEKVFKLRPDYAQSYRDLANAYLENEQFQKAWRLYMNYLLKGNKVEKDGIGKIIYNEMEWLYFNRNNQTNIKQRFEPINKTLKDFRNDVRMVFEWNTSEAEFDLEFVAPDKRVYIFEHSLEANNKQIIEEKKKGYSSREFFIENIKDGEWLANFTYYGNKKPEPTFLKLTIYYNWGKHNQRQIITNYMFDDQTNKVQLCKINEQSLVTTN